MVQRYQQPELPSLVVGTPGVDQSAGQAAKDVADAAQKDTSMNLEFATRQFQGADSDFSESMQQSARQGMINREAAARTRELQNGLQVASAKLDQQNLVDKAVTTTMQAHQNDPYAAVEDFRKNVAPQIQSQIKDQYQSDPYLQKGMLVQMNGMLEQAHGHLNSIAPEMVNANINAMLKAIPAKIDSDIGNIDNAMPAAAQLAQFNRILAAGHAPYGALYEQSKSIPGKVAEIDTASVNLHQMASKHFLQAGISAIPDTPQGLAAADQWEVYVKNPKANGLDLGGDDKSSLLSQLATQRKQSVQAQVGSIQSDTQVALIDLKSQQAQLAENFSNPQVRQQLMGGLHDTLTNLQAQFKQVQAQPADVGSPQEQIKKAQLQGLSQQMGQLLGGEKQGLQEMNSFDSLQRNMVTFAHSMTTFSQGQLKFQQGQEDRSQKQDHVRVVTNYIQQMQGVTAAAYKVLGMPLGPDRMAAAQDQANKLMSTADDGFKSGAINANQYKAVSTQAHDLIMKSEFKKSNGFFGIGAGNQPVKTPQDKAAAAVDAAQKMMSVSQLGQKNITNVQTLVQMAKHVAMNDQESASATKYLMTHGQADMDKARSAGKTQKQIEQMMPTYLGRVLDRIRQGDMK